MIATYVARVFKVEKRDRLLALDMQSRVKNGGLFRWNLHFDNICLSNRWLINKIKENTFIEFDLENGQAIVRLKIVKKPIHRPFMVLKPKSF